METKFTQILLRGCASHSLSNPKNNTNIKYLTLSVCAALLSSASSNSQAYSFDELSLLSLEDLLNISVSSASGTEESYREAPAAMVIVTKDDIAKRGYSNLMEMLSDLPGFDNTSMIGIHGQIATQRGYRTPIMQRTLIMVNSIVENHLWTHASYFKNNFPITSIERVEVLYGPAGEVYGPNAFLGIINIITKDAKNSSEDFHSAEVKLQTASYNTQNLDAHLSGKVGDFSYNLGAQVYRSDNPAIDDYAPWGFFDQTQLNDRSIWGPLVYDTGLSNCNQTGCPHKTSGTPFGDYSNDANNHALVGNINYKNFTLGTINWKTTQGYGVYYPTDRAQPSSLWSTTSKQTYLRHQMDINDKHNVKHLLSNRESLYYGDWGEATPDNDILTGPDALSSVSISTWNSQSDSWLFKQDHQYQINPELQIVAGLKYERKRLTKAYDVCGYWSGSFCSAIPDGVSVGAGIAESSDDTIAIQPKPLNTMPRHNQAITEDHGIYIQGIWDLDKWRINGGVRYDKNSIYGSTVNPRASAVYYYSDQTTLKLLYGTAFQEPAPAQLWGGWNGRRANSDLAPEKAQNIELILMHQQQNWLHDISIFRANYDNVIKEEAENAGKRHIYGIEYRGNFTYDNFIQGAGQITGYINYTHTKAYSSVTYNHEYGLWMGEGINNCELLNAAQLNTDNPCKDFNAELGDIAPHKLNFGINIPINDDWQVNLRSNYVSSKTLYLRNALREDNIKNDSYVLVNATVQYHLETVKLAFKVNNLFDKTYYHSGPESGSSGIDFSKRSAGWHNSLIPQLERNFSLTASFEF